MSYEWQWSVITGNYHIFVQGALAAMTLALLSIMLGTVIGIFIAFARRSENPVAAWLAQAYIEFFRALPILVLLVWVFYVLPILFGITLSAFVAAALSFSLNLAAFVAETVRAGIESVQRGQFESGVALGMTYRQVMIRIVLPQAFRNMLPNLLGLYITELKYTSIASVIAVNEVLHRANILISNTFRPLEIYSTVAVTYLIIILPFVLLLKIVEKRLHKSQESTFGMEYERT